MNKKSLLFKLITAIESKNDKDKKILSTIESKIEDKLNKLDKNFEIYNLMFPYDTNKETYGKIYKFEIMNNNKIYSLILTPNFINGFDVSNDPNETPWLHEKQLNKLTKNLRKILL